MSFNMHWHKRAKMEKRLRENIKSAWQVTIRPKAFSNIYRLLKKFEIVSSRRDLARKCGVSSTTIDDWLNEPDEINAQMKTLEKVSEFILPHLARLHRDYDERELADELLGEGTPLRRDFIEALRGK